MKKYLFEAFDGLNRLAPGSTESTQQAIKLLPADFLPKKILDIGCGVGESTLLLAKHFSNAEIIAIDNNQQYINELESKATNNIKPKVMSMFEMDFEPESFDLIWSEGSIYIAGFQTGLKDWKKFLKNNGYFVCSEISWLIDQYSDASKYFWNEAYPEIDTIENNLQKIQSAGYKVLGHFVLPKSNWKENYYAPLQKNLERMKTTYNNDEKAQQVIALIQSEIDLYKENSDDYSYVFYIMKKI
ncbi:class I SAM-dependent methyltransferase [Lawsonia intracellularis]|uniref:SAM-dependent methyltransferases n=1 Tax=Lawsonia intracellularis (strain PHE/MN1-00) TaxID=363253 RepID=Q1MS25_LAWIP|nr:class I SAM-dependent methyltransferase [Lawsonia intracellularis]AGC49545.1 SAM-dependent methyltransferase [Lawsonia intracellularis N343]KAA0205067.1 class I SAM-dependent methyltransferase [Lawsonia intracellularis]MBZ3892407.1 class I SAM-dependent methyltransferase [Lawsonia intracellularis]RBN32385.1 class I SAM-dependent methyltransferase [Lawsonia intracellularis]RBN33952.1 class I SAM-dependent methyltransferase [Lawsonia intracellularis]